MSFIAPILPDNAPFSPLQRAWLDGYLAALFADAAAPTPSTLVPQPKPQPQPTQAEAEDFPWHDPALPLDDRLALAAARPIEHRLMAAMGQLDCGQCGYLCRSYAEAIARGDEKQLSRCVPGGKATSRALKELLSGLGDPAFQQPLMDQPVFLRRKNMRSNRQIVVVTVYQLERKHDRLE